MKCEADGCDMLDRLQAYLGVGAPVNMSSMSTDARLDHHVAALEAELQGLKAEFSDHRDDSRWHKGIATIFA
jgi:hypothetical protein